VVTTEFVLPFQGVNHFISIFGDLKSISLCANGNCVPVPECFLRSLMQTAEFLAGNSYSRTPPASSIIATISCTVDLIHLQAHNYFYFKVLEVSQDKRCSNDTFMSRLASIVYLRSLSRSSYDLHTNESRWLLYLVFSTCDGQMASIF
jgi:hypothetical protein